MANRTASRRTARIGRFRFGNPFWKPGRHACKPVESKASRLSNGRCFPIRTALPDLFQHRQIGGSPCEPFKFMACAPAKPLVLVGHWLSTRDPAIKRQQTDRPPLILPWHRIQRANDFHLDAQLLAQFPHQSRLRSLAMLHLAAGKLPQPAEVFARRPQTRQHAAFRILNHTANHIDHDTRSLPAGEEWVNAKAAGSWKFQGEVEGGRSVPAFTRHWKSWHGCLARRHSSEAALLLMPVQSPKGEHRPKARAHGPGMRARTPAPLMPPHGFSQQAKRPTGQEAKRPRGQEANGTRSMVLSAHWNNRPP